MTDTTLTSRLSSVFGRRVVPLRPVLALDAAVTAANGAAYIVAAGPIGDLLGLSPGLLRGTGAFLLAFAALVAVAARSRRPARRLVAAIVTANVVWALDSLVVAVAGWGSPTTGGTVWIAVQGLAVGALGAAQAVAMRQSEGRSRRLEAPVAGEPPGGHERMGSRRPDPRSGRLETRIRRTRRSGS